MRSKSGTGVLVAILLVVAFLAAPVSCADESATQSLAEQIAKSAVDWVKDNECQALLNDAPNQMSWIFKEGGWSVLTGSSIIINDSNLYYRIDWPSDARSEPHWSKPTWLRISAADTGGSDAANTTNEWLLSTWIQGVMNQPLLALSLMTVQGPPSESEDGSAWVVVGKVEMLTMLEQFVSKDTLAGAAAAEQVPRGSLRVTLVANKDTGRPVSTEIQIIENPGITFVYSWVPWLWQPAEDDTVTLPEYLELRGEEDPTE